MIRHILIASVLAGPAPAQDWWDDSDRPTVADAKQRIAVDEKCEFVGEWPEFVIYVCDEAYATWIFAQPNSGGDPGYIRRALVEQDGALYMQTRARSDGSDAQQPAFQAWMERYAAAVMANAPQQ